MLALLMAAVIQATVAFPESDPYGEFLLVELPPPWDELEIGQWHYVGPSKSNQSVTFVRAGPRRGLVWTRYEFLPATPDYAARSTRILHELDCGEWKLKQLQLTSFDLPNLTGRQVEQYGPGSWNYAAPDTIGETILKFGCRE